MTLVRLLAADEAAAHGTIAPGGNRLAALSGLNRSSVPEAGSRITIVPMASSTTRSRKLPVHTNQTDTLPSRLSVSPSLT